MDPKTHPQFKDYKWTKHTLPYVDEPAPELTAAVEMATNATVSLLFIQEDVATNPKATIGFGSAVALDIDGNELLTSASHVAADVTYSGRTSDMTHTYIHEGKEYMIMIDQKGNTGFARLVTFGCDDLCKENRELDDAPSDMAILEAIDKSSAEYGALRNRILKATDSILDAKTPEDEPAFGDRVLSIANELKTSLEQNNPMSYEPLKHVLQNVPQAQSFHGIATGIQGGMFRPNASPFDQATVAYITFRNSGYDEALQATGRSDNLDGESRSIPKTEPGMSGGGAFALVQNEAGDYKAQWAGNMHGGLGIYSSFTPAHKATGVLNALIAAKEFQGRDIAGLEGFEATDNPEREDWIGLPAREASNLQR